MRTSDIVPICNTGGVFWEKDGDPFFFPSSFLTDCTPHSRNAPHRNPPTNAWMREDKLHSESCEMALSRVSRQWKIRPACFGLGVRYSTPALRPSLIDYYDEAIASNGSIVTFFIDWIQGVDGADTRLGLSTVRRGSVLDDRPSSAHYAWASKQRAIRLIIMARRGAHEVKRESHAQGSPS
ncbi:hypothetical protein CSAL01_13245 [Colletotrichum salicis]|uniref:Uncharacterized protein n=1 Tax=Colletotrichum salicis TaxID=1209931 RepID=A0A135USN8_9PEZI|nr:hypothetical protein CSAL01_13245 [Colletotrichum salicis]